MASDNRYKKLQGRQKRAGYHRPNRGFVISQQQRDENERLRKLNWKKARRLKEWDEDEA